MFGQREITFHLIQLFLIIKFVTPYCAPSSKNITQKTNQRIFNGIPASLGEVPYQIAFKHCASHGSESSTFCGGSIVKPTIIVSAAHCFVKERRKFSYRGPTFKVKLNSKNYYAVAGNLNTYEKCEQGGGQWRTLKQIKVPYNYKFPNSDVAIVHVKKLVWNNDVKPIPYASKNLNYGTMSCQISGYGDTKRAVHDKDVVQSNVLLKANVKLIDNRRCEKLLYKNTKKLICTEHHISDSGMGDSGGPLVCKGTKDPKENSMGILVGIVSGSSGKIPFYTRVSSYKGYIARGAAHRKTINYILLLIQISAIYL